MEERRVERVGGTKRRGVLSSWLSSSPPLHSAHSDGNILGGERLIGSEWKWGRRWESALLPAGRVRERGDDGGQLEALLEMKSAAHKPQLTEEPDGWNIRPHERRCVGEHRCFHSVRRRWRAAARWPPALLGRGDDNAHIQRTTDWQQVTTVLLIVLRGPVSNTMTVTIVRNADLLGTESTFFVLHFIQFDVSSFLLTS